MNSVLAHTSDVVHIHYLVPSEGVAIHPLLWVGLTMAIVVCVSKVLTWGRGDK